MSVHVINSRYGQVSFLLSNYKKAYIPVVFIFIYGGSIYFIGNVVGFTNGYIFVI